MLRQLDPWHICWYSHSGLSPVLCCAESCLAARSRPADSMQRESNAVRHSVLQLCWVEHVYYCVGAGQRLQGNLRVLAAWRNLMGYGRMQW